MQYGTIFSRYINMGKQKKKRKTERTSPIQQARSELERDRVRKKNNAELSLSSQRKCLSYAVARTKNLISLDALMLSSRYKSEQEICPH